MTYFAHMIELDIVPVKLIVIEGMLNWCNCEVLLLSVVLYTKMHVHDFSDNVRGSLRILLNDVTESAQMKVAD